MGELWRHHAAVHWFKYLNRFHGIILKLEGVARDWLGDAMIGHIQETEAELSQAGVGGTILLRCLYFLDQFLRDVLASEIMLGKAVEIFALAQEVLVELRWQLHKVAIHVGARSGGVFTLREHTMQAMAKLVHESLYLVVGEQRGLGVGGTCKVHCEGYNGAHIVATGIAILLTKVGHPRTALLGLTGEEVGVEQSHKVAIIVGHVINLNFGMEHLCIEVLGEVQAIETCCQTKHSANHILQLEIRSQQLVVDGILLFLEFIRVI